MDDFTRERYGPIDPADLLNERWPWRGQPRTDTAREVARRRRQLWAALADQEVNGAEDAAA